MSFLGRHGDLIPKKWSGHNVVFLSGPLEGGFLKNSIYGWINIRVRSRLSKAASGIVRRKNTGPYMRPSKKTIWKM